MRRPLVIAAAGITVGLVALLVAMREAPSATLACDRVVPMVAIAPVPGGGESGRDEAGARAKAVELVRVAELLVAVPSGEAAAVQRALSTTADGDRLADLVASQADTLAARHPVGSVRLRVAPLAVRSTPVGDRWQVEVWYVQVVTYGDDAVVEDWRTDTFVLVWERGDWRVADQSSVAGPVPSRPSGVVVVSPTDFENALGGFTRDGLS